MEVGNIAVMTAVGIIGLVVIYVLMSSSHSNSQAWQPATPIEKDKISPIALVEEAHTWFVASKQESDLLESLVRTSYGIACLRAIQNSMQLEEVKGATLPPAVQGPAGLMVKLSSQQAILLNALNLVGRLPPPTNPSRSNVQHTVTESEIEMSVEDAETIAPTVPDANRKVRQDHAFLSAPKIHGQVHREVQPQERLFKSL